MAKKETKKIKKGKDEIRVTDPLTGEVTATKG